MKQAKDKVTAIALEIYNFGLSQIIIDLVQEDVEELVEADEVTPDDIGAQVYDISILIDVYNPALEKDLDFLNRLHEALKEWGEQATQVNKILGLDPNK